MNLKIKDILKCTGGILLTGNEEYECESFSRDTRVIKKGDTFVAIKGETFDIPASSIKTTYTLLQAKGVIVVDNMLNLSNILGMIIKQDTLEKKLESIKDEI